MIRCFILSVLLLVSPLKRVHGQQTIDAKAMRIKWSFVSNNPKTGFVSKLTLSGSNIPKAGWKLYFSLRYHSTQLSSANKTIDIVHAGGDLFYIKPTKNFNAVAIGKTLSILFTGRGIIANYQDAPSGFFLVNDNNDIPHAIPTSNVTLDRGTLKGADAKAIFEANKGTVDVPDNELSPFLPQPVSYTSNKGGFILDKSVGILNTGDFDNEASYLKNEISGITGLSLSSGRQKKTIVLKKGTFPDEGYQLKITRNSVVISASDGSGIFYGIQSLKNMLPVMAWSAKHTSLTIACADIQDQPRFPVRAFMLDVSRNFQPKAEIMKLMDVMALYKLNTFHFHLTDDEGWRIQIPGLPELTDIGAKRGYPYARNQRLQPSYGSGASTANTMGSGFYTRKDFIEILKYAKIRYINVIPEIESPGHARAAVKAMEARYWKYKKNGDLEKATEYLLSDLHDSSKYTSAQYFNDNVMNPALPSTYKFITRVVNELAAMYKEAGAKLTKIHMGGDEVPDGAWEKSPSVKAMMEKDPAIHDIHDVFQGYFEHVQQILNDCGLQLYAWEELTIGTQKTDNARKVAVIPSLVKNGVSVDAWFNVEGSEDIPYQAANAGYKTVLTCLDYFYFDMAYQRSFYEPGDEWLGLLETKKTLSFIPHNYYHNAMADIQEKPYPAGYFAGKQALTEEGKANIAGVQGALWGENIMSAGQMEYMTLPRLQALAEKAWAKQPAWETEPDTAKLFAQFGQYWNTFANQLGKKELPKLAWYHGGYNFRIPAAGITLLNGLIIANQQLPGMFIRYTTNGAEPTGKSNIYTKPLKLKGTVKMRVFDVRGRGGEVTGLDR